MKVIEHGNRVKKDDKERKRFKCEKCGCVFECSAGEYVRVDPNQWSSALSYTWCSVDKLYANCPECHKMCETEEKKTYPFISTTSNSITDNITVKGVSTTSNTANITTSDGATSNVIIHKHPSEE